MTTDNDIQRAQAAKRGNPFLSTAQAAAYLGLSSRKLEQMRAKCDGPPYRLHGRFIRYHIDDVEFWSRSTMSHAGRSVGGPVKPPAPGLPDPGAGRRSDPGCRAADAGADHA